jgi:pyruvate formate lyase activating enzyme
MELLGRRVSATDLFAELAKDSAYYQHSGGGVTLSGGEPALQPDFCGLLMARLQASGIHTAIDTCGMTSWTNLEKILPHTNLVLYDLKEIDPDRHKDFTGYSNQVVLSNLLRLCEFIKNREAKIHLWIRTPLIPGATATKENITGIGAYLASQLNGYIERWELPAFNNLCRDKYRRLGMDWDFENTPLLSHDEMSECEVWAKEAGLPPESVMVTGAARVI